MSPDTCRLSVLGPCSAGTVGGMRVVGTYDGTAEKALAATCSVEGCAKFVDTRGLCSMHYRRLLRGGTTELRRQPQEACSIEGCNNAHEARGFCQSHYKRWQRHKDPLIRLNKGCAVPHCLARSAEFGRYCLAHAEVALTGTRVRQAVASSV